MMPQTSRQSALLQYITSYDIWLNRTGELVLYHIIYNCIRVYPSTSYHAGLSFHFNYRVLSVNQTLFEQLCFQNRGIRDWQKGRLFKKTIFKILNRYKNKRQSYKASRLKLHDMLYYAAFMLIFISCIVSYCFISVVLILLCCIM